MCPGSGPYQGAGSCGSLDRPNGGSASTPGGTQTDALRATATIFQWQMYAPGHLVSNTRPNGASASGSSGPQTDALRAPAVSFQWQFYAPGHLVGMAPSNGSSGGSGDMHTDALRTGTYHPSLVYGLGRDDSGGLRAAIGLSLRMR